MNPKNLRAARDVPTLRIRFARSSALGIALILSALCASQAAEARAGIVIPMKQVTSTGIAKDLGKVVVTQTPHGAVFTPDLHGLKPGLHGFHLHEKPDCAPAENEGKMTAAEAAGGHFDPDQTGQHGTPWGEGHRGDLPPLYVDAKGMATQAVLAPRLKADEVKGHALMIHAGGDNHADHPKPLGGGAARVACGVAS